MRKETKELVVHRMRVAYNAHYYDFLYELMLQGAGLTPEEARKRPGRRDFGTNEPPLYADVDLVRTADGVTNKVAQDAKFSTMSLSLWKPELTYSKGSAIFKAVNNAYFSRAWWELSFGEKLLEVDSDANLGMAHAVVGIDEEGKPNWYPYSPLRVVFDPYYKRPDDWRYFFTVDEYDPEDLMDRFGLTFDEAKDACNLNPFDGVKAMPYSQDDIVSPRFDGARVARVYRYFSKASKGSEGGHAVIIGSIGNSSSIWLALDPSTGKYQRLSGDAIGKNPYSILPIQTCFEMLLSGVKYPVGRAHWDAPLAAMSQRVEASIMRTVDEGDGIRILSAIGLSEQTVDYFRRGGRLKDLKQRVLVAEHVQDIAQSVLDLPAAVIPQDRMMLLNYLVQQRNEASGHDDAARGQREGGNMTAFEFAGRRDAQGIQARHLSLRKAVFIGGLWSKIRAIAAQYDHRSLVLELDDGNMVPFGEGDQAMSLGPFLEAPVRIDVTEDSMTNIGQMQRAEIAMQRFQRVDLPCIMQLGTMDPVKATAALIKDVYGVVDPGTRGVLTPDEFAAKMQGQKAQQDEMMSQEAKQKAGEIMLSKGLDAQHQQQMQEQQQPNP